MCDVRCVIFPGFPENFSISHYIAAVPFCSFVPYVGVRAYKQEDLCTLNCYNWASAAGSRWRITKHTHTSHVLMTLYHVNAFLSLFLSATRYQSAVDIFIAYHNFCLYLHAFRSPAAILNKFTSLPVTIRLLLLWSPACRINPWLRNQYRQ